MSNELSVKKPDYLTEVTDFGTGEMNQYCQPPRLKIIQAMTADPFKPPFKDGDIIAIPQMVKLGDFENPFVFTPVYFFPMWVCWNPPQLRQTLPAIREYSYDPKSDLAKKSKNFALQERCPEDKQYLLKYAEMLHFFIVIHNNEQMADLPVDMFFNRGEYKTGQALIGLIQSRKGHMCALRLRAASGLHKGKKGSWYGLNFANDSEPWNDEATFNKLRKLNADLKDLQDTRKIQLDLNDSDVEGEDTNKSAF